MNQLHRLLLVTAVTTATLMACVPRFQYVAVEDRLQSTEQQLQEETARRQRLESQKDALESRQTDCDTIKNQNRDLTAANGKLAEDAQVMSENYQRCKSSLEKHKSVVYLQRQVIELLDDTKKTIVSSLEDQIAAQGIEFTESDDELRMVLLDRIVYESGSLEISSEGKKLLLTLAETLRKDPSHQIVVEGHTDNLPLSGPLRKLYPTNWELSAARAATVARFLQWEGGLDPKQLSIRAFSFYRPIASNDTEEGRRQNRRIEIVLMPAP
jgi:chemotaxis protein MotB